MSAQFVNVDRETPMLLPPDLRDWVSGDDMVHFVLEEVNASAGADPAGTASTPLHG